MRDWLGACNDKRWQPEQFKDWNKGGFRFWKYPRTCSVVMLCPARCSSELQHARLPWASLSSWVCSNSCPLSRRCSVTVSSWVIPFSCLQSSPASGSFPKSPLRIRWPKCWNFSNSPSNGYSGLIFFRIDWFDLLAVQGILKSLLQHHNLKAFGDYRL